MPRTVLLLTTVLVLAGGLLGWRLSAEARARVVEVGFWVEDVSFRSARLGGELASGELARIEQVAMEEVAAAFAGLRIRVTANRQSRFHVRAVQEVRDLRSRRTTHVAGQSRSIAGFGGGGVVNFTLLASGATVYAPAHADRATLVDAIGRGIGRSAVHELAHQLLPRAPLHQSRDRGSYEFYSAGRQEQYFGAMRWDHARPLLQARFGTP